MKCGCYFKMQICTQGQTLNCKLQPLHDWTCELVLMLSTSSLFVHVAKIANTVGACIGGEMNSRD